MKAGKCFLVVLLMLGLCLSSAAASGETASGREAGAEDSLPPADVPAADGSLSAEEMNEEKDAEGSSFAEPVQAFGGDLSEEELSIGETAGEQETDEPAEEELSAGSVTVSGRIEDAEADNDALFAAYVERLFHGESGPAADGDAFGSWRYLDDPTLAVYQKLLPMILDVAEGRRASTVFEIPFADVLEKTSWTADELGVSRLARGSRLTSEARNAVLAIIGCDDLRLFAALLADCPYELYWFDKTAEYTVDWNEPILADGMVYVTGGYTVSMQTADGYASGSDPYRTDKARLASVQDAVRNAERIVSDARGLSDYDILHRYLCTLCDLNEYNIEAAEDADMPYGDPWQLIWMFDGDPDTNVVCEGYSKAFQYLCDMTDFAGPVCCYTVVGDFIYDDDAGGGHMWNIVRMDDGRNYLVDVTNCDTDPMDESLFLKGIDCGSVLTGYTLCDEFGGSCRYEYDFGLYYEADDVRLSFSYEDLLLSPVDYGDQIEEIRRGAAIDETNFPDPVLRAYLTWFFDWEEDGFLSAAELSDINYIDLEWSRRGYSFTSMRDKVTTLQGLGLFPNLRYLYCENNSLSELDVSRNPLLETLWCPGNALSSLDLSRNPRLIELDCAGNSLTQLDVAGSTGLRFLRCEENSLSVLDLRRNAGLLEQMREGGTTVRSGVVSWHYDREDGGSSVFLSYDKTVELLTDPVLPGDVFPDGRADRYDAAVLLQYLVGLSVGRIDLIAADINENGRADASDAAVILAAER